jgi:hypothetical protein
MKTKSNKLKKLNLNEMAGLVITSSSYSGEQAGQYIAPALLSAKSLDDVTVLENVKYKRVLNKVEGANLVTAADCDFANAGTLTLTESVLAPTPLKINIDLCSDTMAQDWMAQRMRAGRNNNYIPQDFEEFVVQYLGETVADHVETNFWNGAASGGGFQGIATDTTGILATNTDVVDVTPATITLANVLTKLGEVRDAIPAAVYGAADLNIYISTKIMRLYIAKMAELGYLNQYNVGAAPLNFEGINLVHAPGLAENRMCAMRKSNIFFGTDLFGDMTQLSILDMSKIDGSSNVRCVMKFSAGGQIVAGEDCVFFGTTA